MYSCYLYLEIFKDKLRPEIFLTLSKKHFFSFSFCHGQWSMQTLVISQGAENRCESLVLNGVSLSSPTNAWGILRKRKECKNWMMGTSIVKYYVSGMVWFLPMSFCIHARGKSWQL